LHHVRFGGTLRDVRGGRVLGASCTRSASRRLKAIIGDHVENPPLDLPCRMVFATGQRFVEVVGPLLEEEAATLHIGVWDDRRD
jgi:hypothetical protein